MKPQELGKYLNQYFESAFAAEMDMEVSWFRRGNRYCGVCQHYEGESIGGLESHIGG